MVIIIRVCFIIFYTIILATTDDKIGKILLVLAVALMIISFWGGK